MQLEIDDTTIQRLKQLFPERLAASMSNNDVGYFVGFMAGLGVDTVNVILKEYPYLTFGDVITRYSSNH